MAWITDGGGVEYPQSPWEQQYWDPGLQAPDQQQQVPYMPPPQLREWQDPTVTQAGGGGGIGGSQPITITIGGGQTGGPSGERGSVASAPPPPRPFGSHPLGIPGMQPSEMYMPGPQMREWAPRGPGLQSQVGPGVPYMPPPQIRPWTPASQDLTSRQAYNVQQTVAPPYTEAQREAVRQWQVAMSPLGFESTSGVSPWTPPQQAGLAVGEVAGEEVAEGGGWGGGGGGGGEEAQPVVPPEAIPGVYRPVYAPMPEGGATVATFFPDDYLALPENVRPYLGQLMEMMGWMPTLFGQWGPYQFRSDAAMFMWITPEDLAWIGDSSVIQWLLSFFAAKGWAEPQPWPPVVT